MADKRFIAFRLRKEMDDDLYDALAKMDSENIAELCRMGLRRELGITKIKVKEVREVPLPAVGVKLFGRQIKNPGGDRGV